MPSLECILNRILSRDLMKLEGRKVLHVVDRDKKFSFCMFLSFEKTIDVWEEFIQIWVSLYVGYQNVTTADQGPQFTITEWGA